MHTVQNISNFLLEKSKEVKGKPYTQLELMKILFFSFGWYSAYNDGKYLFNETFNAWKHGPVIESLYHQTKHHHVNPINETIPDIKEHNEISNDTQKLLTSVVHRYKNLGPWDLVNLSHLKGSPWYTTYEINKDINGQISTHETYEYYKKQLDVLIEKSKHAK